MTVLAPLPAWAIGLLALLAGVMLLFLNHGWLLAARAMLKVRSRKDGSPSNVPSSGRDEPTRSSMR